MEKRKKAVTPATGGDESELNKELERLVNENKALLKVLEKISPLKVDANNDSNNKHKSSKEI